MIIVWNYSILSHNEVPFPGCWAKIKSAFRPILFTNYKLKCGMRNIALSRAIEEGEKSKTVSRDEIFKVLSGE